MTCRRFALVVVSALFALGPLVVQAQPTERVVADMLIRIVPQTANGHCLTLPPGQLTVSATLVGEEPLRVVNFSFYGYRGLDRDASIDTLVSRTVGAFTTTLSGGMYCYAFENRSAVSPTAGLAELTSFAQDVAFRMVIAGQ